VINRRAFIATLACGFAAPLVAVAQQAGKVWQIGWLGNVAPVTPDAARLGAAFRAALGERGFVEGRNVVFEYRYGEGNVSRYPALAAELVALGVDLFVVTSGPHAVRAVQAAKPNVPIVIVGLSDPVGNGLVPSLARPGGNITGTSGNNLDLIPKRLELLKAAVPRIARIANVQGNFGTFDAANLATLTNTQEASARALGITLVRVELNTREQFDSAIAEIVRERPDALLLSPNPLNFILRQEWADFGIRARLPIMGPGREWTTAGALIAYGPSNEDIFRKTAGYVAKILNGANPGDLPIEEPTKFELVINLKTAKALGLTIPQSVLLRADEVIQ
jgi:putative ABC transport system substrate-binding protein